MKPVEHIINKCDLSIFIYLQSILQFVSIK